MEFGRALPPLLLPAIKNGSCPNCLELKHLTWVNCIWMHVPRASLFRVWKTTRQCGLAAAGGAPGNSLSTGAPPSLRRKPSIMDEDKRSRARCIREAALGFDDATARTMAEVADDLDAQADADERPAGPAMPQLRR